MTGHTAAVRPAGQGQRHAGELRVLPARPGVVPGGQRAPGAAVMATGDSAGLQLLDDALAAGTAAFGRGSIALAGNDVPARLRRLRSRLAAAFVACPEVAAGERGVWHERDGLTFTDLHLAGRRYLVGCGEAWRGGPLVPGQPVDVITGLCMFGADSLVGLVDGHTYPLTDPMTNYRMRATGSCPPIDAVLDDPRPHVQETEGVARLGSFICDLAAELGSPVRVHAHIPRPEYETYGLDLYARGVMTAGQCNRFIGLVRRREVILRRALEAAVQGAAHLIAGSPMAWLDTVSPFSMEPGLLARFLCDRARQENQLWRDLIPEDGSISDLRYASNVCHYLAVARTAQRRGHQVVLAENPDEQAIFGKAMRARERTGMTMAAALGFYVHPQAVVNRTAFGLQSRLLYNCADGCAPTTHAIALGSLEPVARAPHERLAGRQRMSVAAAGRPPPRQADWTPAA